jgi:chromosome transmission fidelity protein 4
VSSSASSKTVNLANEDQDPPGPTFFSYTPNGKKLITAGGNGALRVFEHLSTDEPAIIDVSTEDHLALAARNEFFVVGSEDGSVTKYSLATNSMDEVLVQCSLPVRDVALSPDGQWCAVASECVSFPATVVTHADTTTVSLRSKL